jgi:hypothetical protein
MEAAMPQLQKIEIDLEIHKLIEAERRSFDEPSYVALRRLLNLPDTARPHPQPMDTTGRPWSEGDVVIPHGSLARMKYGRGSQVYEGTFLDGKLIVNGRAFETLSAAANALATTKDGRKPSLNGWLYWEARFPGESHWRSLNEMRKG